MGGGCVKVIDVPGWRYFVDDDKKLDASKAGKWMYFFRNLEGQQFAEKMCRKAVSDGVVIEAKRGDSPTDGVACFYLNCDDDVTHKRIISFFIEHNMIRKTKTGKLYDISFKMDRQTLAGEYRRDLQPEIKLSAFINLYTGEWLR